VTGLPTGSGDQLLGSLILDWQEGIREYLSFYELPTPPSGTPVGEVVQIGRTNGAAVDASLDRLEATVREIRTYIGRDDVSADPKDLRLFVDAAALFLEYHRSQNDMTAACWPLIPESLYSRTEDGVLREAPEFLTCLFEVVAIGETDAPDNRELAEAATTVYDQIIAGES
jgi:hypothetical protein